MKPTAAVNADAIPAVPIACRYPEDRLGLLDTVQRRLRLASRSDLMRHALDELIERHLPGSLGRDVVVG